MTIAELHFHFLNSTGVCTDTRSLQKGQLYFALKGENFNGNSFASKALKDGAALAVVDESYYYIENSILVPDVLETLQQLATYHRNYLNIPIIGLTGSNGKTTTKELIHAVLLEKYKTVATKGNLNNNIGVPLSLLSMDESTEIGVIEMGANHQGEIKALCAIAQPNFGYITNFGKAHLEGFGGFQGVIKGKSELYDYLRSSDGIAFVNNEDPIQLEKSQGLKSIRFSGESSHYPVKLLQDSGNLEVEVGEISIQSNLMGSYNFSNIAAAVAIGQFFEVEIQAISQGIQNYTPENNRSQIITQHGKKIILDAYNANPTSMVAALDNLDKQLADHRIAYIGDMFEIGKTSKDEHQAILDYASRLAIDKLIAIGPDFGKATPHENQQVYTDYETFASSFNMPPQNSTILIKGSRGMKMERILDLIK